MLWLKSFLSLAEQSESGSLLERYIDAIYEPFWKRELDVEDLSEIARIINQIGAPAEGFLDYAKGEGASLNNRLQGTAFDAGIFGVPTYIFTQIEIQSK